MVRAKYPRPTMINTLKNSVLIFVPPDLPRCRDLAADAGMLFVFPTESPQSFWMKNTPLPLDMVFIGADRRIVGIVVDTKPFSTNPLGVDAASQYVLEVHAGFCAQHGIAKGND